DWSSDVCSASFVAGSAHCMRCKNKNPFWVVGRVQQKVLYIILKSGRFWWDSNPQPLNGFFPLLTRSPMRYPLRHRTWFWMLFLRSYSYSDVSFPNTLVRWLPHQVSKSSIPKAQNTGITPK